MASGETSPRNVDGAVTGERFHWGLKLAMVLAVARSLLLVSYHSLVRFTAIGQVLNGRRRERAGRAASAEALPINA